MPIKWERRANVWDAIKRNFRLPSVGFNKRSFNLVAIYSVVPRFMRGINAICGSRELISPMQRRPGPVSGTHRIGVVMREQIFGEGAPCQPESSSRFTASSGCAALKCGNLLASRFCLSVRYFHAYREECMKISERLRGMIT